MLLFASVFSHNSFWTRWNIYGYFEVYSLVAFSFATKMEDWNNIVKINTSVLFNIIFLMLFLLLSGSTINVKYIHKNLMSQFTLWSVWHAFFWCSTPVKRRECTKEILFWLFVVRGVCLKKGRQFILRSIYLFSSNFLTSLFFGYHYDSSRLHCYSP